MYPAGFKTMAYEIDLYKKEIGLEAIKMPTLIVHGTSDKDIPFTQSE
jgi:pimeloyl-ACP methyl ester carboxylesterase